MKIVFDGDDTLWYVEWLYSKAYADFFSYIYATLQYRVPNIHFVYRRFFEIEARNAKTWGVRQGRVAQTMAETYREICEWVLGYTGENIYQEAHERTLRKIGDQPFDLAKHMWVPGAQEVLTELQRRGHELYLLTKYDKEVWPRKAVMLNLSRFFPEEHIRVVERRKTKEDFLIVSGVQKNDRGTFFTVGNSEGDMVIAEADKRWRGFHILFSSTVPLEYDIRPTQEGFDPVPYSHPRVTVLKSIREIFNHV